RQWMTRPDGWSSVRKLQESRSWSSHLLLPLAIARRRSSQRRCSLQKSSLTFSCYFRPAKLRCHKSWITLATRHLQEGPRTMSRQHQNRKQPTCRIGADVAAPLHHISFLDLLSHCVTLPAAYSRAACRDRKAGESAETANN